MFNNPTLKQKFPIKPNLTHEFTNPTVLIRSSNFTSLITVAKHYSESLNFM